MTSKPGESLTSVTRPSWKKTIRTWKERNDPAPYRKDKKSWPRYVRRFLTLMAERRVETKVSRDLVHLGCLLCGEHTPDHCHRRLVAEYLREKWGDVAITHLL
ncbi:MAG: DUF488 family protein [Syntrophobacteraceae bacterium]